MYAYNKKRLDKSPISQLFLDCFEQDAVVEWASTYADLSALQPTNQ